LLPSTALNAFAELNLPAPATASSPLLATAGISPPSHPQPSDAPRKALELCPPPYSALLPPANEERIGFEVIGAFLHHRPSPRNKQLQNGKFTDFARFLEAR
jgi:hypothetical protein